MSKFVLKKSPIKPLKIDYAKELNAEQLAVVQNGDGPVLVLAGAGSGKTRTIVYRVAWLLEHGVSPNRILLVTFTNKAAKEMLVRVQELLGDVPSPIWGGTFHHVANRILRKYAKLVGRTSNFSILDEEDSRSLVAACLSDLNIDTRQKRFPSASVVQHLISFVRNTQADLAEIVAGKLPNSNHAADQIKEIAKRYEARKQKQNSMDFDDLLVLFLKLLTDHAEARKRLQEQFQYVLVDEFQDTNALQGQIVKNLADKHGNLLVVGDDAQSIYAFRGADINNILEFPKNFPQTKEFKLQTNYRSVPEVLNVANAVIAYNVEQYQKVLKPNRSGGERPKLAPCRDENQEAAYIAQRVLEFQATGMKLAEIAVLVRAVSHTQAIEFELAKREIPYLVRGGLRFFERAHIKDVVSHLKILANPNDEVAWLRALGLQVGVGPKTATEVFLRLQEKNIGVKELAKVNFTELVDRRANRGIEIFQKTLRLMLVAGYKDKKTGETVFAPQDLIRIIATSDYVDYLRSQYPNADERLQDLEQLALFAGKYKSLNSFLADVSLQEAFSAGAAVSAENDDALILSTVHQAKGLEWEAVFVPRLTEGGFPNARALDEPMGIEEERRLFYVAVTRAKTWLTLTYPLLLNPAGSMILTRPSRFIEEVPESQLDRVEIEEEAFGEWDGTERIIQI
ncbi:ATP-dependent helicase [Candidatus Parcubacteria bacterium]|jgi:DNA helicase-2/ATP-dependent DNA helicase PcrA|nr:MAG: ATP-dependent helicase [Candidatus Parcubacteria bacterium]